MPATTTNITVVGAGRMGRGIALSFAFAGYTVHLCDSEERLSNDFAELDASVSEEIGRELGSLVELQLLSAKQADTVAARVALVPKQEASHPLSAADFVFEAVTEVLEIKATTYRWLNTVVAPGAIIGSTTSTMLVDTLAEHVDTPQRFLNTHWLNPALLMPLVEVSPGKHSGEDETRAMRALLEGIGKTTVVCAPSPGFIVPRLQALAMTEAARCVEEGVASAEDVDKAVRLGFGVRYTILGLLEFIDWGGGDIVYHATRYLAATLDEGRFSVPEVIERNMQENRNGVRDGEGFYDYRNRDVDAYRQQRLGEFVALLQHLSLLPRVK